MKDFMEEPPSYESNGLARAEAQVLLCGDNLRGVLIRKHAIERALAKLEGMTELSRHEAKELDRLRWEDEVYWKYVKKYEESLNEAQEVRSTWKRALNNKRLRAEAKAAGKVYYWGVSVCEFLREIPEAGSCEVWVREWRSEKKHDITYESKGGMKEFLSRFSGEVRCVVSSKDREIGTYVLRIEK